jgi:hypothetical protein
LPLLALSKQGAGSGEAAQGGTFNAGASECIAGNCQGARFINPASVWPQLFWNGETPLLHLA